MNKKGQVSEVFIKIAVILVVGLGLYAANPIISEVKDGLLSNGNADPLTKLFMFLLLPFIWILYFTGAFIMLNSEGFESEGGF